MEKPPKISIVTPSYNQGIYLEETILSVLEQKYPNLEYILIDGGSTDNSVEIIKKYEKHLAYWISEKDNGQTHAINKGFSKSTGTIFNWLNSDDYLEKNALTAVAKAFSELDTEVVCGLQKTFFEDGSYPSRWEKTFVSGFPEILIKANMAQPCTFFRKKVLDNIFPLTNELHFCFDQEMWLKYLLLHGEKNIKGIDTLLVNFRVHENAKTRRHIVEQKNERASIFYSMLIQKKEKNCSSLLKKYFHPSPSYILDCNMNNLDMNILKHMVCHQILKWAKLIFDKNDFRFALDVIVHCKNINRELYNDEKEIFDKLCKNTLMNNWFLFKIKRKYYQITKKQLLN